MARVLTRKKKSRTEIPNWEFELEQGLSSVLTSDLIVEILNRLSTETLITCKCVCKSWGKLISDPIFITRFINRSKSLPPSAIITGVFGGKTSVGALPGSSIGRVSAGVNFCGIGGEIELVDDSLSFLEGAMVVIASDKGYLLCAQNPVFYFGVGGHVELRHGYRSIVCNPVTKQWRELPKHRRKHNPSSVLFCYDKGLEFHFKVVSLISFANYQLEVGTFSSETGKWKESKIYNTEFEHFPYGHNVVFNESVCMLGYRHLCAYDLKKQSLSFLELPFLCFIEYSHRCRCLGVSAGSLCISMPIGVSLGIWKLVDEGEWFFMHNIDVVSCLKNELQLSHYQYVHHLVFHPVNPDIILVRGQSVLLFNCATRKIESITELKTDEPFIGAVVYCLPAWIPCLKNAW
ncbi:hypothetical protein ACHQM5_022783 [Ranunculus cassubicifolius]